MDSPLWTIFNCIYPVLYIHICMYICTCRLTWRRHQMETFSALLAICAGNSPVSDEFKGRWRGTLMFSLISARINGWVNNHEAGDLRRIRPHYGVTVMTCILHIVMYLIYGKCGYIHHVNPQLLVDIDDGRDIDDISLTLSLLHNHLHARYFFKYWYILHFMSFLRTWNT